MAEGIHGEGRIYIGEPPAHGPHPGFRGAFILLDGWVHLGRDAEWLAIGEPRDDWPDSEWRALGVPHVSIPAAAVSTIEWTDGHPGGDDGE